MIKRKFFDYRSLIFIIIICLLLISREIFSLSLLQENYKPSFEVLNRNDGLSNLSISSIVQDKYGFLWFGSQGGLNCYDGRNITVFRSSPFNNNGLIHNLIQTIYYDKEKHELWLGTYQGISRFNIATQKFKQYTVKKDHLSNPIVIAITKDKKNQIWAGTMEGLNKIDPESGKIINYKVPGNTVRSLFIDEKGKLYIGTYKGLCYFDKKENKVKKIELKLPTPYVMVIKEYKKGILTLALWDGGIAQVNLSTKEVKIKTFKDNRIYTILKTSDGTLWAGSWGGGLFAIKKNGKEYSFFDDKIDELFNNVVVYSLFEDSSKIFWIGTNGHGVIKLNPRKHNYIKYSHNIKNKNSIKPGKINKLFRDSKDNLWIEIYGLGLNRYNPSKDLMENFQNDPLDKNSLIDNRVNDIIETKDGNLMFATGKGIITYSYETNQFKRLDILSKDITVYAIKEDKNSILWIGTYSKGIYSYNYKTKKLKHYNHVKGKDDKISDNLIYDILIDSKQRVWVATNNGLDLYETKKDKFKTYYKNNNFKKDLGSNVIRTLMEDSKNRIWIGTNGGGISLFNEKGNNFKTYTEKDGLASNNVNGILEGNDGRMWISGLNGISILDPEKKVIDKLSPEDGIGGWEFNKGVFKEKDGTLLFGGIHGVVAIPPDFSHDYITLPKVYISDIKVYNTFVKKDGVFFNNNNVVFSPSDNFIEFKFVGLDYDSPKKIKFSYKLEGFNDSWVNIGKRNYVSFSNLAPGNYRLLVNAKNFHGIYSKTESMTFTIKKHWYETNIAFAVYFILIYLAMFMILKIREWYLLRQKNSELSLLNEKLNEKNKELESISLKDHLTGLYNRRYFNTKIDELLFLSKRSNTPLSLLMIDLDDFKSINDTFGHLSGDDLLSSTGKAICKQLSRETDFAVRYGGDEFAIILYDTDENGAYIVAEKIKNEISKISVKTNKGRDTKKYIKTSIGLVSIIPKKDTSIENIIDFADKALYQAKKRGKNNINIFEFL